MTEDEQIKWVSEYCDKERIDNTRIIPHPEIGCDDYEIETSLASLAFRIRDEIKKSNWDVWLESCWKVHKAFLKEKFNPASTAYDSEDWILKQGPIFWIITALIAGDDK